MFKLFQPQKFDKSPRNVFALLTLMALNLQAKGDVVQHVEPGQQRVFLKDHRAVCARAGHHPVTESNFALAGRHKACDQIQ